MKNRFDKGNSVATFLPLQRWSGRPTVALVLSLLLASVVVPPTTQAQPPAQLELAFTAANGITFEAETTRGGRTWKFNIGSAWGEQLKVRLDQVGGSSNYDAVYRISFGDELDLYAALDGSTKPVAMAVDSNHGQRLGTWGGTFARLQSLSPASRGESETRLIYDESPEALIAASLRSTHSDRFLAALGEADFAQTGSVGCMVEAITCFASAVGIVIAAAGIAACPATGPLTPACWWALAGLAGAKFAAFFSCMAAVDCASDAPDPDDIDIDIDVSGPSPILIDMDRNQFHLSGAAWFDVDADGTRELVSWPDPSQSDQFLSLDKNGNGEIDNDQELFGDATILKDGSVAEHGFEALAQYDLPENGGNGDGQITANDEIFESLLLWSDSNLDGISQGEELEPAPTSALQSISLRYRETQQTDEFGSWFRFASQAQITLGSRILPTKAADVFLHVWSTEEPSSP